MKKILIALLMLASVTAFAQRGEATNRAQKKSMTAEQMATLKTKKMTLALDLNEAQQSEVKALNLEAAKMRMKSRKAQKSPEERKKLTADERFEMTNKRLDAQIARKEKVKQILTDAQFAKWEKMKNHRGRKAKKGRSMRAKGKEKMKKEN